MSSESVSSYPLKLSSPSLLANPAAIQQPNPFMQLAEEFGLKEAEEVHTRLFMKTIDLRNQHNINAVHNEARASARALQLKLQTLKSLGATAQQLRQVGLDTLKELETTSNTMMASFERFQAGSSNLEHRYAQFDASASKPANPLTWAAFSEPSLLQANNGSPLINVLGKYMIKPQSEQTPLETVNDKVKKIANGHELDKSSHEKHESLLFPFDTTDETREYSTGKMGHLLKHRYGEGAGYWFEFGVNILFGHVDENSKSPWRDRIISADVHITIAETLALCLPSRLPAYLAIAGAHTTAKVAKELENQVDKLAENRKLADLWNYDIEHSEHSLSFSDSIALCKLTLKTAQVPSQLLHEAHHKVVSATSQPADAIGITDDNLIYIARKTLSLLAKYSPEVMEENVWRDAYLDISKKDADSKNKSAVEASPAAKP